MIYNAPDIPLDLIRQLPDAPKPKGNPGKKKRPEYKAVVCAFDIETTALPRLKQSFMYIWQLQIGFDITIVGRTWDDFLQVLGMISECIKERKLITYVHNLSYEFQFLSGIWHFEPEDVFCTEPRSILYATMGPFEFRCSYRLANMSLDQFTRNMKVAHRKLSGSKFDYSKKRYPWTRLSEYELNYATYDVIGLVEAVTQMMINEEDNLYSIPLTSTGFPRRDVKRSMKTYNWNTMQRQIPPFELQLLLKKAFRGGNTHADRHFIGQIIHDVWSWDMASAYPAALICREFPTGRWYEVPGERLTLDYLSDLINRRHKAVLLQIAVTDIHLRDTRWPVPYLALDKCDHVLLYTKEELVRGRMKDLKASADNGRILAAKYLETVITDVDLKIILDEYEWPEGQLEIKSCWFSTYGPLPGQFREVVSNYYQKKTTLKGVHGQEFVYDASKRKLNAIYGGTVMDPIQSRYLYNDNYDRSDPDAIPYQLDEHETIRQIYERVTRYPYQSYAWGVWVTAYCRQRLEDGIRCVYEQGQKEKKETGRIKTHFVYCDTDSIKYVGNVDVESLNKPYIESAIKNKAFATDPKGKVHYLGVYECEGKYPEFITWGAKKYCYRDEQSEQLQTVLGTGDTWHITIAGVNKKEGAKELERAGGINCLLPDPWGRPRFTFHESGGVEAVYNDDPPVSGIQIGKHWLPITRNVYLQPHAYTLSVTDDFSYIINHPDIWRDLLDAGPEV